MRNISRRFAQLLLIAGIAIGATSLSLAANYVWEGEQVGTLSGAAFKIKKLTKDPMGKVSGGQVLAIDKLPPGQKVPNDSVSYKVKIPAAGKYYLWARVRWSTGCGNSFLMNISSVTGTFTLGGDATYDALHWIPLANGLKPRVLTLKKETVTFTLGAKESGAMVDQFLLTTDAKYKPAGIYQPTPDLLEL